MAQIKNGPSTQIFQSTWVPVSRRLTIVSLTFPILLIPFQFYPHESSNYGASKCTCSSLFHLFPMKMASNGYGVSTPRSAAAPVVPLLPASSAFLRAPELPGPSRNVQGTCLRRRRAEKMGDILNMSIWLGKYEKFMIKLWRNLKNLSQKQLAFVKESCSTGLRWTSVGEAWDLDHWHR